MKEIIRKRLERLKRQPSAAEVKAAAARLKENWDTVFKPEGRVPYFEYGDREIPVFESCKTEYSTVNAWVLAELSRLLYTPTMAEARRDPSRVIRFEYLEKVGLRELESFNRRSNHAAIYECGIDGGCTIVCFRGTTSAKQWLLNLTTIPVSWGEGCHVHQGFRILFEELWPKISPHLAKAKRPLIYAGHSLGGALANLAASRHAPDALYTFGAPRVGNSGFGELLCEVPAYRIVNGFDIVTLLPHSVETFAPYDFHHAGELRYMTKGGEMIVQPKRDELPDTQEQAEQPLSFLRKSFKSPSPPDCLVDHAPSGYVRSLERRIVE